MASTEVRPASQSRIENIVSKDFGPLPPPPEHWSSFMAAEAPRVESYGDVLSLSSKDFAAHINSIARDMVQSPDYHDEKGYISATAWKRFVDGGVLAASLGDRDPVLRQEEMTNAIRTISYYGTDLGLAFGIMSALAILPIQKFGSAEQQNKYIGKIREGGMIGLAVTEPNKSGANALDMDSRYKLNEETGRVHLNFTKHIQGLSGRDGLVVAALKADVARKTMGVFIVDKEYIDTQMTSTIGLKGVPYGINKANVELDAGDHLLAELPRDRLDEFKDLFIKSRILFVSMMVGQQERTEIDANSYAATRVIASAPGNPAITQAEHPVTKNHLGGIRTRRIISEAILARSASVRKDGKSLYYADTRDIEAEANIIKVLPTEYTLKSREDRARLMGSAAFYEGSALQDYIDSWPFQIFEGPKDMLDTSVGRDFSKSVKTPESNGFFGKPIDESRMDSDLPGIITKMRQNATAPVLHEVLGQVAERCFALECLDREKVDPNDFELATEMLNLEIKQIALEFEKRRKRIMRSPGQGAS